MRDGKESEVRTEIDEREAPVTITVIGMVKLVRTVKGGGRTVEPDQKEKTSKESGKKINE